MTTQTTLLLDSNYIAHQARFVFKDLPHEEQAMGIVFGFLSRVLGLGQMFRTNDFVFCWDSKLSWRKRELFGAYKQRKHTEDLSHVFEQFTLLRRRILPAIGFRAVLMQPGIEADDLIARVAAGMIDDVVIVSGDDDLLQCVRANVRLYNPSKRKVITRSRFVAQWEFEPDVWPRVKALAGCRSDKVPGVRGVAEKTAAKYILGRLNTETDTYERLSAFERTREHKRNIKLVKLPYPRTKEVSLGHNCFSIEGLRRVCERYGLDSFLEEKRLLEWRDFFLNAFEHEDRTRARVLRKGHMKFKKRNRKRT